MAILKDKAYESAYSTEINNLIDKVINREAFDYDPANDAAYKALAKEYGRLGDMARENTLADVALNTGGLVSSYATTAAQQAQNQYNQALTDKIPALMEAAYSKYQDELTKNMNLIGVLQGLDDSAYGRFADQREYDYKLGRDQVADEQWQLQFGYNQLRDQIADQQWQSQFDYAQSRDQVADNQWQTEHDFMVKQQEYENKFNEQEAQYEKMLTSWNTLGYATKEVAKFFGVKEGTKTSDERYAAASLALDQAKFAYSKQQNAARDSGSSGVPLVEDRKDIRSTDIRNFQSKYLGADDSATTAQKAYADRMAESLAQNGDRMTNSEITDYILNAAGLDEDGNRVKASNGMYVENKITYNQAVYLMERYGGK